MARLPRLEPQVCCAQLTSSFSVLSPSILLCTLSFSHSRATPPTFVSLDSALSTSSGTETPFPVGRLVHCPRMILHLPVFSCPGHLAQGLKSNLWSESMGNVVQLVATKAWTSNSVLRPSLQRGKGRGKAQGSLEVTSQVWPMV